MAERETLYKRLYLYQRRRYIIESGRLWPGRSNAEPPATCYPNILAELAASRLTLDMLAEYARVTPEIMAAVLEDCEQLRVKEFRRLAFRLDADPEYLTAPLLWLVEPESDEGKCLVRRLDELTVCAVGLEVAQMQETKGIKARLTGGKPVTYAELRWGYRRLSEAIECYRKKGGKYYGVRVERITAPGR